MSAQALCHQLPLMCQYLHEKDSHYLVNNVKVQQDFSGGNFCSMRAAVSEFVKEKTMFIYKTITGTQEQSYGWKNSDILQLFQDKDQFYSFCPVTTKVLLDIEAPDYQVNVMVQLFLWTYITPSCFDALNRVLRCALDTKLRKTNKFLAASPNQGTPTREDMWHWLSCFLKCVTCTAVSAANARTKGHVEASAVTFLFVEPAIKCSLPPFRWIGVCPLEISDHLRPILQYEHNNKNSDSIPKNKVRVNNSNKDLMLPQRQILLFTEAFLQCKGLGNYGGTNSLDMVGEFWTGAAMKDMIPEYIGPDYFFLHLADLIPEPARIDAKKGTDDADGKEKDTMLTPSHNSFVAEPLRIEPTPVLPPWTGGTTVPGSHSINELEKDLKDLFTEMTPIAQSCKGGNLSVTQFEDTLRTFAAEHIKNNGKGRDISRTIGFIYLMTEYCLTHKVDENDPFFYVMHAIHHASRHGRKAEETHPSNCRWMFMCSLIYPDTVFADANHPLSHFIANCVGKQKVLPPIKNSLEYYKDMYLTWHKPQRKERNVTSIPLNKISSSVDLKSNESKKKHSKGTKKRRTPSMQTTKKAKSKQEVKADSGTQVSKEPTSTTSRSALKSQVKRTKPTQKKPTEANTTPRRSTRVKVSNTPEVGHI